MDLLAYIIPAAATIIIALIELRSAKERKQTKEEVLRTGQRADRRAEESRLSMELMSASCKLGVVTAKAVTHQHVNGDVEEAMTAAKEAQEQYDKFLHKLAAKQTVKV
ncbi:MAG: hypothetical protein RSG55_06135 [Oscillospiraceae bacterium]